MTGSNVDFGQIPMTGSAIQLTGIPGSSITVALKNTGAAPMYLGKDATVSSTTGWPLAVGEAFYIDALNARKIWVLGTSLDRLAWSVVKP